MLEFFKRHLRRQGPGETLLRKACLDNVDDCLRDVMVTGVPGDLVECGVWRGGACMLMRALLMEYSDTTRTVWLVDSFKGCPDVDPVRYPVDGTIPHSMGGGCYASLREVRDNFQKYGLEDGQVKYLEGWFKDTLPNCTIGPIALLRVDADTYGATCEVLQYLYDKVSVGGWIIDDDYGAGPWAKAAVDDFRKERGITEPLSFVIDSPVVFWNKRYGAL